MDVWLETEKDRWEMKTRVEGVRFLQLYPESCEHLADSPERAIEVATFVPPTEICKMWSLDNMGKGDGVQAFALAPVAEGGCIKVRWNDVYLQQPKKGKKATGPRSPATIFMQRQIDNGVTDWRKEWKTLKDMTYGNTWHEIGEWKYKLRHSFKLTAKGRQPQITFEEDSCESPYSSITKNAFRDKFKSLLKKYVFSVSSES